MHALRKLLLALPWLVVLTLSCNYSEPVDPSDDTGTLTIRTKTVGTEIDQDGYAVRMDGGLSLPIGSTADLTFISIEAGDHSMMLDGVAPNCQVAGENPRSVTVSARLTATIVLEVICSGSSGFLEISTVTSGEFLDSDGYQVAISTRPFGTIRDVTSPLRIFPAAGTHEVALSGIAANCRVEGGNPRPVAVTPPAIARTTFQIVCLPPPGAKIFFERTGPAGDLDLWVMNADGTSQQNLGINRSSVLQPSWSPDGTRILFMTFRAGGGPGHAIGVMSSIGSHVTDLRPGELNRAAWSEDGQIIVFSRVSHPISGGLQDPQIWVMNANGSGETMLTDDIVGSYDPAWSPGGSRISFTRGDRINLMNADGGAQRALTNPGPNERDEEARWSPDGHRLAFVRVQTGGSRNLWTINPDGSDPRRLTDFDFTEDGSVQGYSWAPDGSRLTFSSFVDVYTIHPDGSGAANLTNSPFDAEYDPSWSPDGGSVLYTGAYSNVHDIFVLDVNTHTITNLTNGSESGWNSERAQWQP